MEGTNKMRYREILETCSGSVAIAPPKIKAGTIGAGFDPDGDWGIYEPNHKGKKNKTTK